MKKLLKKMVLFVLAFAMCMGMGASLTACGGDSGKIKIGVGLYQDSGPAVTATKNYLNGLADALNCEFEFVTLSQTNDEQNKTTAQSLISGGCKGLILTMDGGFTASVLEECRKAGVYLAGYLSDYETNYNNIKNNEYFLGTVVDGSYTGYAWGTHVAERIIAEGYKNIGMIKFPSYAFPHQSEMDQAFREKIAEYNATAADGDKITMTATTELQFQPLAESYLEENPNLDAIFAMCAGVDFVYPTLVKKNKTNIKLYTAGFSTDNDVLNNFGTSGNGCIQELVFSNVEAITYPLVMMINKITGHEFSDNPSEAQRVDSSQIIITNNEQLNLVKTKSLYCTGNVNDAFLSVDDVKALLAENGGTHAKLVEAVQSMDIDDLAALNN